MKKFLVIICFIAGMKDLVAQRLSSIDSLFSDYTGKETPGACLAVIQNGKIVYQQSYGMSNIEQNLPVTENTNFRLASVTKQFTAAAILMLVNEGKLTLDQTLTQTFPGFPSYGEKITLRHLLTHTSGLAAYENYVPDSAMHPQIKDKGVLDIMMKLDTVYFKPVEQYRYSNTGYALLALVIEKYSGMSYAQFLKKRIFDPLRMTGTMAFEKGISSVPNRAFGYSKSGNTWIRNDQSSTSAVLGDGGIYSNVTDMAKWDKALYTNSILPEKLLTEAFSDHQLNNGIKINYGFGWHFKTSDQGDRIIYHTGSTTSFRNIFYRIPSKNFSIVILTNRNEPSDKEMIKKAEEVAAIWLQR